jgi:thioesterase domain-containing protein
LIDVANAMAVKARAARSETFPNVSARETVAAGLNTDPARGLARVRIASLQLKISASRRANVELGSVRDLAHLSPKPSTGVLGPFWAQHPTAESTVAF